MLQIKVPCKFSWNNTPKNVALVVYSVCTLCLEWVWVSFRISYHIFTRYYTPFDYKHPHTICKKLLWKYIYLQFMPPWPHMEYLIIHNKNGRILRLRWMRGRLGLTVTPYIESSYLLASDTPTIAWCLGRLIASWWLCENCIAFSDHTHSAPSFIHDPLPCRTEPLWASSQAARDGDGQFCHCCFPCALHRKGSI